MAFFVSLDVITKRLRFESSSHLILFILLANGPVNLQDGNVGNDEYYEEQSDIKSIVLVKST